MPDLAKHEVVAKILDIGLVPTFYNGNIEIAQEIIGACAKGGAKVVEFTNRGPLAHQVFSELSRWVDQNFPDVAFGAGTVIEPSTASLYINSGASFIVGPAFNPEVGRICNRRRVTYIPGCCSPPEISEAEEIGADIIKVFPAKTLGHYFIKAVLGPCPWSKLMPSGGVEATREDIFNWIKAGAAALNIGGSLIQKDLVKSGDFEGIRTKVEDCVLWINEARGTPLFLGVEHIALYPSDDVSAERVADWYSEIFNLNKVEGQSSIVVWGAGQGRIEVVKKKDEKVRGHIAIHVSNFKAACNKLRENGVKLEEPIVKRGVKAVYLKGTDPLGNRVHLIYKP